jgi:hypothetical protein
MRFKRDEHPCHWWVGDSPPILKCSNSADASHQYSLDGPVDGPNGPVHERIAVAASLNHARLEAAGAVADLTRGDSFQGNEKGVRNRSLRSRIHTF